MEPLSSSLASNAQQICLLGKGDVSEVQGGDLLARLVNLHGIDSARHYWWKSLKGARSLHYGDSVDGWRKQVDLLVAEMGSPVFMVVTDDAPLPWPVLKIEDASRLPALLGEVQFFDYFVFSNDGTRVFFDTHDNVLWWTP